jgi:hypothetical protein
MKFKSTSSDSRVRSLRLLLALACLLPLLALAAPPGWWTDRQVLDPNAAKSDFGSVNQGQLKNMAKKAYAELRNALPSEIWTTPQGQALAALVDSWNPAQTGNFDIINQGQLKAVAKKFYDVLILHGYTDAYPWTGATTAAANDALANLGQLKNLFSFDLTRDSDGDGIPDWQETKFNLNPFNGQTNLTLSQPPPPPPLLIGVPNDWQGWTNIGLSNQLGVYGSGSTSALYDVYANQFYLNAALGASSIPVGNQYVTGDPTGLFTYSPGAFTGGNRILGIGVQGVGIDANVSGFTPTVKFALGDNTYSAATSVPGTDGRVSFSLYSHPGDFTVQFQPVEFAGSQIYRPSNITFRGDDNVVYTLPGGIGSGASYDFAFRAIPLTSSNSYQMFFDLDAMQSLYSDVSLFQATFNRQNVLVAPGTNYNGQGIGTIGSTVTIALNGLSNNTTVFSVDAPPRPPVELLQHPIDAASGAAAPPLSNKPIRFCRWIDAYPNGVRDNGFADTDRDRFQIRIPGVVPGLTKMRIKSTGINGAMIGGTYQDKATDGDYEVDMSINNGNMVSVPILLVADGDDDKTFNGVGVADDGRNDQTLLANFDSKVIVSFPELGNATATFFAQPAIGQIELDVVYCSPGGGLPANMETLINRQIYVMRGIYRQIGIKVKTSGIRALQFPAAWIQDQGATDPAGNLTATETDALVDLLGAGLGDGGDIRVRVGFVDAAPHILRNNASVSIDGVSGRFGVCLISLDRFASKHLNTLAHEVGHSCTLTHQRRFEDPITGLGGMHWLMKDGVFWDNDSNTGKRFLIGDDEVKIKNPTNKYYVPIP